MRVKVKGPLADRQKGNDKIIALEAKVPRVPWHTATLVFPSGPSNGEKAKVKGPLAAAAAAAKAKVEKCGVWPTTQKH